jgi:hypothetical protein
MGTWKPNETVFEEYDVRLTLPGRWQPRPAKGALQWVYRSADHREHITLCRGESVVGLSDKQRTVLLQRAAEKHRRGTELELARSRDVEIGELEWGEVNGAMAGWYCGTVGQPAVQYWAWIWSGPEAIWSVVYEASKLKEGVAEEHAEQIANGVGFVELEEEW